MKEFRNPPDVHAPVAAYSHQIEVRGPERLLVLSGQVGMKQDGTVPSDPAEQLDVALENVLRNLKAANMDVRDLIKLTVYLVGEIDAAKRRQVFAAKLRDHQPCMTLIFVASLAGPMFRVEVDAWASSAG